MLKHEQQQYIWEQDQSLASSLSNCCWHHVYEHPSSPASRRYHIPSHSKVQREIITLSHSKIQGDTRDIQNLFLYGNSHSQRRSGFENQGGSDRFHHQKLSSRWSLGVSPLEGEWDYLFRRIVVLTDSLVLWGPRGDGVGRTPFFRSPSTSYCWVWFIATCLVVFDETVIDGMKVSFGGLMIENMVVFHLTLFAIWLHTKLKYIVQPSDAAVIESPMVCRLSNQRSGCQTSNIWTQNTKRSTQQKWPLFFSSWWA